MRVLIANYQGRSLDESLSDACQQGRGGAILTSSVSGAKLVVRRGFTCNAGSVLFAESAAKHTKLFGHGGLFQGHVGLPPLPGFHFPQSQIEVGVIFMFWFKLKPP
jgi:hypothetical protein